MKDLSKPAFFTPESITSLQPNESFVFGSNIIGHNSGGAADIAVKRFGAHERCVRKYGVESMLQRGNPCHFDGFFPYRGSVGPVYIHTSQVTEKDAQSEWRNIPSCGNGMGPYAVRESFELSHICGLLENDEKYEEIDNYFIPVADYTLSVYHRWFCRIQFASDRAKMDLITDLKTGKHGR